MSRKKDIAAATPPQENFLWSLFCNILAPVFILNKGSGFFPSNGALYSLLAALAFPVAYGLREYLTAKHINRLSAVSLASVLLTGGMALIRPKGIFFAVKEALVPLIFALFAAGSVFYKKPLLRWLFWNSPLFDSRLIWERARKEGKESRLERLMNEGTLWLAGSFLLSSVLNFIIAVFVFKDIDPKLSTEEQAQILNEQIADMTWMGYVMIALPLMVLTGWLMYWTAGHLKKITKLSLEEMLNKPRNKI